MKENSLINSGEKFLLCELSSKLVSPSLVSYFS